MPKAAMSAWGEHDGALGVETELDLGPDAIAGLVGHGGFQPVALAVAKAFVDSYAGNWALNRLLNDRGRFLVGLLALDMHFVGGQGGGFTAAAFRAEALARGCGSPGRVTAMLASLRLFGFVSALDRADAPDRLQRLAPTEKFFKPHRERWDRLLRAMMPLRPELAHGLAPLADARFLGFYAHGLLNLHRRGWRLMQILPEFRPFTDRDAGMVLLLSLFVAAGDGRPVSIAELARRFSVSRAHVMKVLRVAQASGLAELTGSRGGYSAGPALGPCISHFVAALVLTHCSVIARAVPAWRLQAAYAIPGPPADLP